MKVKSLLVGGFCFIAHFSLAEGLTGMQGQILTSPQANMQHVEAIAQPDGQGQNPQRAVRCPAGQRYKPGSGYSCIQDAYACSNPEACGQVYKKAMQDMSRKICSCLTASIQSGQSPQACMDKYTNDMITLQNRLLKQHPNMQFNQVEMMPDPNFMANCMNQMYGGPAINFQMPQMHIQNYDPNWNQNVPPETDEQRRRRQQQQQQQQQQRYGVPPYGYPSTHPLAPPPPKMPGY